MLWVGNEAEDSDRHFQQYLFFQTGSSCWLPLETWSLIPLFPYPQDHRQLRASPSFLASKSHTPMNQLMQWGKGDHVNFLFFSLNSDHKILPPWLLFCDFKQLFHAFYAVYIINLEGCSDKNSSVITISGS